MQLRRLAFCPKQFLQKRLSRSGGWSLQEQPQLLGREKRSSFWVNFEHVRRFFFCPRWSTRSLFPHWRNGPNEWYKNMWNWFIGIYEGNPKLNNYTRCQNLWRAPSWDLPMLYMHLGSGCDLNFEDICYKDNLQFWAKYQNESSRLAILAWAWVSWPKANRLLLSSGAKLFWSS